MNKKSNFSRRLIAVACSALALGAAGSANAGVLAQGVLEITNFKLINSTSGSSMKESDFAVLVANHQTDGVATLNGISSIGTANDNVYPFAMDLSQQSVGVNPFGQNDYTHRPAGYGGYFARSDTILFGDSMDYDVPPHPGTGATGVTAKVVGEVQLNGAGSGSTQANIGLQADFVLKATQAIRLDFNADDYLIAFLGPLAPIPGSAAQASSSWSITLTDDAGLLNYSFAPNGQLDALNGEIADPCSLNTNRSRLITGASTYSCVGAFSALSPVLTAGTLYHVSIRHAIESDAEKVPEPGTLVLLGAGLLGVFGGMRRGVRKPV